MTDSHTRRIGSQGPVTRPSCQWPITLEVTEGVHVTCVPCVICGSHGLLVLRRRRLREAGGFEGFGLVVVVAHAERFPVVKSPHRRDALLEHTVASRCPSVE